MASPIPLNQQVNRLPGALRRAPDKEEYDEPGGNERGDALSEGSTKYGNIAKQTKLLAQKMGKIRGKRGVRKSMDVQELEQLASQKSNKMDAVDIGQLISVSLMFDAAAFIICLLDFVIPLLGTIIEVVLIFPIATLTLYLMKKNRGVNFSSKILVRFWGARIIGFIPYLSLLPEYTLATMLVIASVKAEEVTGLKHLQDEYPHLAKYIEKYLGAK